jgi:hypothetical protein
VSGIDFRVLAGKPVFFDPQYLDGTVDRGYVVSSLRQQLLAAGCLLQEDRTKATYVVEVRSGGIGTNRHALLIGVPQMNVPTLVPGQPSQIPEIPLAKKTDQEGIAKIAVFAYNRTTGQPIWQSGVVQAMSTAKDTWLLGAGPFQNGTIRKNAAFAGEPLPIPHFGPKENPANGPAATIIPVTRAAAWRESPLPRTVPTAPASIDGGERGDFNQLVLRLVSGQVDGRPPNADKKWPFDYLPSGPPDRPTTPAEAAAKPKLLAPNLGGQAETEPCKILMSGTAIKPEAQIETEPSRIVNTGTGFKPDS